MSSHDTTLHFCVSAVPVPGAVGAGLGRSAVANKELPRGGFELDSRVLGGDSGVDVDHAFLARG
jgi:hypothetical protein